MKATQDKEPGPPSTPRRFLDRLKLGRRSPEKHRRASGTISGPLTTATSDYLAPSVSPNPKCPQDEWHEGNTSEPNPDEETTQSQPPGPAIAVHAGHNGHVSVAASEPGNSSSKESRRASNDDTGSNADSRHSSHDGETGSDASIHGDPRDLWAEAWASDEVGDEGRKLLGSKPKEDEGEGGVPELLDSVIDCTKHKLVIYNERWGSADNKTAPGVARSIVLWALSAKELIDAILKFDPMGYGSFGWAVIAFGLKLVQNDKDRMDLIFEACGYLANLMARYSRLQGHYWARQVNGGRPLEDAIINVYKAILVYSTAVKQSLNSTPMNRVKLSFISLTGQPLEKLKKQVGEGDKIVEQWQQQIDRERQDEESRKLGEIETKADSILEKLDRAVDDMGEVKEIVLAKELQEMLEWLFKDTADRKEIHQELRDAIEEWEDVGSKRHENDEDETYTPGEWFIRGDYYVEWKKYPQSLLWLYGSSGCGKSSLCSTIIQDLEHAFVNDDTKALLYWYFRFDLSDTQRMELVLRSMLGQLISKCKGVPDKNMLEWFRRYRETAAPMKTAELIEKLITFIGKIDKDVFIVLDGLDELPISGSGRGLPKFLEFVINLLTRELVNLHVLLVSKDMPDIRSRLTPEMDDILTTVDVREGLDNDLDDYITKRLDKMSILSRTLKEDVKARLNEGQERNFLWSTSLLNEVAKCRNANEVPRVLQKVPTSMAAVYEAVLMSVTRDDEQLMRSILIWLMRQFRPLSPDEFAAAVEVADATSITQCAKTLVESSRQTTTVNGRDTGLEVFRVTHFSVKEYLESVISGTLKDIEKKPKVARFVLTDEDVHLQMTRRCLDVLSVCSVDECSESETDSHEVLDLYSDSDSDSSQDSESSSQAPKTPVERRLLHYAAEYWFRHYRNVDRARISTSDLDALDKMVCQHLQQDSRSLALSLKIYNPDIHTKPDVKQLSPVYYAVSLELKGIPEQLIAHIKDTSILDRRGPQGTALQLSAHLGHTAALNTLVDMGVNVNAVKGDHGTALYAAAARGDKHSVRRLLGAGAEADGTDAGELGNPLHIAAFHGHDAVVRLLLEEKRVQVDRRAGLFGTALQAASASRKLTTVKLLLEYEADPNIVAGSLGTALQAASSYSASSGRKTAAVETALRSAGAIYQEAPNFWTEPYDRARSRNSFVAERLWRHSRGRGEHKYLSETQQLLAWAIREWTLDIRVLMDGRILNHYPLLCRIPFEDQVDDIVRAAPERALGIEVLSRSDFIHNAFFWATLNRIFRRLSSLLQQCVGRIFNELRLYFLGGRSELARAPSYAFRWAFCYITTESHGAGDFRESRHDISRMFGPWHHGPYMRDTTRGMDAIIRSDIVAAELMQHRQRQESSEIHGRETLTATTNSEFWPGPLVMGDILALVKNLVQYGGRCTRYQDAVFQGTELPQPTHKDKAVKDLTFVLFSAVLRLALALGEGDDLQEFQNLRPMIQQLTKVRLTRIRELDALCEAYLPQSGTAPPTLHEPTGEEIADRISRQIRDTITTQLTGIEASIVHGIKTQVSDLVTDEMGRLQKQMQLNLEKTVQEEVQHLISDSRNSQEQGGWLSMFRGR